MKMSKLTSAILAGGLLMAGMSASAEEASSPVTVTGSVAYTSDYLFRGVSQTSENAALQGSLSFAHSSGLYFTAWGSSISVAGPAGGLELDTLLGYAGKAGDVGYDVGVMRYNYPGSNDGNMGFEPDFDEVYGSVSFKGAKLGLAFSPDYYLETGDYLYAYLDYSTEVAGLGLLAHVGVNNFDEDYMAAFDGYVDYKVAVSKSVGGVALELAYIGSDMDDADCAVFSGDSEGACEGRAVATVSKAF